MIKRPRYTDEFRTSAVLMLEAAGYPDKKGALTEVASQLGVPLSTIRGWFTAERNPPPAELRNEKRAELVNLIRDELHSILAAMGTTRKDASYRDLATAFGIFTDKLQLLTGEPTGNSKVRIEIEYADADPHAA